MFQYEQIVNILNNSKWMGGITMLLLNVGSKYVLADLGKFHEEILTNHIIKKFIIFSMFFVATRDIIYAFCLTILYVIIIDGILHEKRKFCIIPKKYKQNTPTISEKEYDEAVKIIEKYKKTRNIIDTFENKYMNNIDLLKQI